jgi:hypothetical protein
VIGYTLASICVVPVRYGRSFGQRCMAASGAAGLQRGAGTGSHRRTAGAEEGRGLEGDGTSCRGVAELTAPLCFRDMDGSLHVSSGSFMGLFHVASLGPRSIRKMRLHVLGSSVALLCACHDSPSPAHLCSVLHADSAARPPRPSICASRGRRAPSSTVEQRWYTTGPAWRTLSAC